MCHDISFSFISNSSSNSASSIDISVDESKSFTGSSAPLVSISESFIGADSFSVLSMLLSGGLDSSLLYSLMLSETSQSFLLRPNTFLCDMTDSFSSPSESLFCLSDSSSPSSGLFPSGISVKLFLGNTPVRLSLWSIGSIFFSSVSPPTASWSVLEPFNEGTARGVDTLRLGGLPFISPAAVIEDDPFDTFDFAGRAYASLGRSNK
mmetsp:Transcript_31436/g.46940  ORF Transcript_31436/g.46940 Transcript_31436/m.46940 type:complete len:207 (-) Transcript_31436:241-861(-)